MRDIGRSSLFIIYRISPPRSADPIIKIVCVDTKSCEYILSSSLNWRVESSDDAINCEAVVSIPAVSIVASAGLESDEDSCGSFLSALLELEIGLVVDPLS